MADITVTEASYLDIPMVLHSGTKKRRVRVYIRGAMASAGDEANIPDIFGSEFNGSTLEHAFSTENGSIGPSGSANVDVNGTTITFPTGTTSCVVEATVRMV